jgi:hypothetical protein
MMLNFNDLLERAGLPLGDVKLIRHQDHRGGRDRNPFRLWQAKRPEFELYQAIQRRFAYGAAKHIASFVVTPQKDTLFVGVWNVGSSIGTVQPGTIDPVRQTDVGGFFLYELTHNPVLAEYEGRVIVGWGDGFRSWAQNAKTQSKPIRAILKEVEEEHFPGLLPFRRSIDELDTMPKSWRNALTATRGVYAMVCQTTGKIYVGSATGIDGFIGRWEQYLRTGDGGNLGMRGHPHRVWLVTILEVASSSATEEDILKLEAMWKTKLLTFEHGLNMNR